MTTLIKQLKQEQGIPKLFELFKQKYRSLGRASGTVNIVDFTDTELEAIAGLIGKNTETLRESGKLSLSVFEKALKGTVFSDYSLVQLIEQVLDEKIITKDEEKLLAKEEETSFFCKLQNECPNGIWWWERIKAKSPDTRWIWSLYKKNSHELFTQLITVFRAFEQLPAEESIERLPLFSQRVTGNPHYFDYGRVEGNLLSHCLITDQSRNGQLTEGIPKTMEDLNELLGHYRLMRDDLWSFVTCRGLLAETDQGIHPLWQAAVETDSVLNVPIKQLVNVKKIHPAIGKIVWIVENSSVCSTIVDKVPEAPIICTHGQFRTASWLLLDHLYASGCSFYYSGDLDPEGLMMAERLQKRYKDRVNIWRMDVLSYERIVSDEDISTRLSKLESITSPDLRDVADLMKKCRKAGYQEGIVEVLVEDILNGINAAD